MDKGKIELESIAALARGAASAPVDAEVNRVGRERVVAAAASLPRRRRVSARVVGALAFAAALGIAGVLWLRPGPLRYEVIGASALESTYVSAPPESPVDVRFSDGSDLRAEAGSRLRVEDTSSNGARVLLERGTARSHVAHRALSRWMFVAGPFEVRVVGTRFDLNWDPLSEEIDLTLLEGSVEVRSPLADGPIVVRAGQRFRATMIQRSMTVTDAVTVAPVTAAAEPAPPAPAVVEPTAAPPTITNSRPARRESWQDLVAHGEFDSVVSAAASRGIDGCLAGCAAADLRSLADAARYTGRIDLADKCLLALRKRFPGTSQSSAAAFLMGRTHESQSATAQRWYETYLAESPDGEFAADALAGKMRVVATTGGNAAAKPLALEYLRRYPEGVHVKTARKIAGLD